MRLRTIVVSLLALGVASLVVTVALARRTAERRLVDLGACLLGEPLAADEKPSDRMLRIELARPAMDGKTPSWPDTCASFATEAASSWALRASEQKSLAKLAEDLGDKDDGTMGGGPPPSTESAQKARSADAIAWFRERRDLSASRAQRPWRPVTMAPPLGSVEPLPCGPWSSSDEPQRAIFGGKPACAVVSTAEDRLSVIRVARPEDALPPRRSPPSELVKELGGEVPERTSCTRAGGTTFVMTTSDRRKQTKTVVVETFDAGGSSMKRSSLDVTSQFDDSRRNPLRSLESSVPVASCSATEVRVAWAWATLIGGKPHEELVVVTCAPDGMCEAKRTVVHVETGRHSNCGNCRPSPDQMQLEPPTTIDLFGVTALIWTYDHALRVRVAPADHLDELVNHVLHYDEDPRKAYLGAPVVFTSRDVAIVGFPPPLEHSATRFFRVATSGARELTIGK